MSRLDDILKLFETQQELTVQQMAEQLGTKEENTYKPVAQLKNRKQIYIAYWIKYEGGFGGPKTAVYKLGNLPNADKKADCIVVAVPTSRQRREAEQQAVDTCAIQELINLFESRRKEN